MEEPHARSAPSTGARWAAGTLLVVAVVAGVFGHLLLPRLLVWILIAILVWAAVTIFWRTIDHQFRTLPPEHAPPPLGPGESYDTAVKLTYAPNVPLAEAICTRMRANGIEAFYKQTPALGTIWSKTGDFGAAEIWVGEHDLERARALLPAD